MTPTFLLISNRSKLVIQDPWWHCQLHQCASFYLHPSAIGMTQCAVSLPMLTRPHVRGHVCPTTDSMVQWHRQIMLHMLVESRNGFLDKIMMARYLSMNITVISAADDKKRPCMHSSVYILKDCKQIGKFVLLIVFFGNKKPACLFFFNFISALNCRNLMER